MGSHGLIQELLIPCSRLVNLLKLLKDARDIKLPVSTKLHGEIIGFLKRPLNLLLLNNKTALTEDIYPLYYIHDEKRILPYGGLVKVQNFMNQGGKWITIPEVIIIL